jgi:hypothetical protein
VNEARAKNGILLAAAVSAAGIFALAAGAKDAGGVFVLAGWGFFIAGIHYYGRAGAR